MGSAAKDMIERTRLADLRCLRVAQANQRQCGVA